MTTEEAIKVLNLWNIEFEISKFSGLVSSKSFNIRVLSVEKRYLLRHAFHESYDEAIHEAYNKLKNRTLIMIDIIEGES